MGRSRRGKEAPTTFQTSEAGGVAAAGSKVESCGATSSNALQYGPRFPKVLVSDAHSVLDEDDGRVLAQKNDDLDKYLDCDRRGGPIKSSAPLAKWENWGPAEIDLCFHISTGDCACIRLTSRLLVFCMALAAASTPPTISTRRRTLTWS